ncbi:MAG: hypothetical protein LQ345_002424 [Seirophora villosa]|nr:MAG: hypothetical protein LQ345_002424 [Seirophora villosa]
MVSTRPIHIYEDPSFNPSSPGQLDHVHPVLDPSHLSSDGHSPLKQHLANITPPSPSFLNLKHLPLPPPRAALAVTRSPQKEPQAAWSYLSAPLMADVAVFGSLSTCTSFDQENHHQMAHSDRCAAFPDFANDYKSPKAKRVHASSGPSGPRKGRAAELDPSAQSQLPAPDELPAPEDTGKKPQLSYAELIGMAILRAPGRRLTLAQIYKWISDSFSFYRLSSTPTGWQNSIRHNLSISDAFTKQERRKDDPGKGNYWVIVPGKEAKFLKQKSRRRPQPAGGPAMKTFSQPLMDLDSSTPSMPRVSVKKPVDHVFTIPQQPSSDATIPASDPISPELPQHAEPASMPPPASALRFSSSSPAMGSSPPANIADLIGEESPLLTSDASLPQMQIRGQKRNATAMNDSGYFSSLESSTARQYSTTMVLNNVQLEKPRLKRGRAEEEIARIRSSSHDASPSKFRLLAKRRTPPLVSSSPLHEVDSSIMLGPLTPSLTFKPALNPPVSVSPDTGLRDHRDRTNEFLGSPIRDHSLSYADLAVSPAFHIPDEDQCLFNDGLQPSVDILNDLSARPPSLLPSPSPGKRSVRSKRLARPGKTTSVLANVTGTRLNRKALTPASKASYLESPIRPCKSAATINDTGENSIQDNGEHRLFLDFDSFADEDDKINDVGGLDILQGFQKIGGNQDATPKIRKAARPALGPRGHTSGF